MTHHTQKQRTLWLLAAIAAPAAHHSGSGWLTAAVAAAVILPLTLLPKSWEGIGKPMAVMQILWLGAAAGLLLPDSSDCWPSDNDLVVPLTLLTLAAFTKTASAPRIGAVLALAMALLAIPVAVSGATHIQWEYLQPGFAAWPVGLTMVFLLPNLPTAAADRRGILTVGGSAIALSVLVQGSISAGVAGTVEDPFIQTARSLGYLEPVAAAGLTLGWYSLAALFFHSAVGLAEAAGIREKTARILLWGTGAGVILIPHRPNLLIAAILSLFFWVAIPLLRNLKKSQNSA